MKNLVFMLMIVATMALFAGCSECDCSGAMADCKKNNGEPEEIDTFSSDGYNSVDYWYWTRGVQYGFTWGTYVSGCCDESVYTFDPIGANATDEEKAIARQSKVLVQTKKEPQGVLCP